ncbi:hypothetical protein RYX36_033545 [Vicia faba]
MPLRNIWNIYHVSATQLFNILSGCRFQVPVNQRRAASGGFAAKEQRMKAFSRQNNAVQHNGAGNGRPPWGRGQYGN